MRAGVDACPLHRLLPIEYGAAIVEELGEEEEKETRHTRIPTAPLDSSSFVVSLTFSSLSSTTKMRVPSNGPPPLERGVAVMEED